MSRPIVVQIQAPRRSPFARILGLVSLVLAVAAMLRLCLPLLRQADSINPLAVNADDVHKMEVRQLVHKLELGKSTSDVQSPAIRRGFHSARQPSIDALIPVADSEVIKTVRVPNQRPEDAEDFDKPTKRRPARNFAPPVVLTDADRERIARSRLHQAFKLEEVGNLKAASQRLAKLIDEFPATAAAGEARKKLETIDAVLKVREIK